jgi:transposase
LETIFERVAGLDVHKAQVTACVRLPAPSGGREQHLAEFSTTVRGLLGLRDWLEAHGVAHVAMEATGVYWQPVWHMLEDTFELMLVNARHVKQVPGRKTDVKDCVWIAQLLEHGLLRGSFVPPAPIRDLRDLTRYRKALIHDRTRVANRLHKALEEAGMKLASVASDILGVSGRAMLAALVQGTTDPAVLADLARGRLRGKLPALRQALASRFRPHHAFVIAQLLAHLDYLEDAITTLSAEIERVMAPWAEPLRRLDTIPGINQRTAEVILAEVGADMRVFPSARHLASWAALCPGHHESGGKHKSGKTRKGNRWLRTALIEAAAGASRAKNSALQARFRRVLRQRGPKKAVVAVAHALLRMVYHVLADETVYREAGADYYDRHHSQRVTRRALQTLERQGYRVTLEPAA